MSRSRLVSPAAGGPRRTVQPRMVPFLLTIRCLDGRFGGDDTLPSARVCRVSLPVLLQGAPGKAGSIAGIGRTGFAPVSCFPPLGEPHQAIGAWMSYHGGGPRLARPETAPGASGRGDGAPSRATSSVFFPWRFPVTGPCSDRRPVTDSGRRRSGGYRSRKHEHEGAIHAITPPHYSDFSGCYSPFSGAAAPPNSQGVAERQPLFRLPRRR